MKALIVIDMQNDFIDGSLSNIMAKQIVAPICEAIKEFEGDIFFTRDTHMNDYLETSEGKKLPVAHCIFGTEGWMLNKDICSSTIGQNKSTKIMNKSTFGSLEWDLECYDEIYVCGTCTDICVVSNVLIIKAMYPDKKIVVLKDLCAGVTKTKHEAALEVMRSCQIDVE